MGVTKSDTYPAPMFPWSMAHAFLRAAVLRLRRVSSLQADICLAMSHSFGTVSLQVTQTPPAGSFLDLAMAMAIAMATSKSIIPFRVATANNPFAQSTQKPLNH